jgi:hypothetical protein
LTLRFSRFQDSIMDAIAPAKHLHTIKLQVQWIPPDDDDDDGAAADSSDSDAYEKAPYPAPRGEAFALADARRMMQQSRLRVVSVGHVQYMVRVPVFFLCAVGWR